jgi:hypothetical protein
MKSLAELIYGQLPTSALRRFQRATPVPVRDLKGLSFVLSWPSIALICTYAFKQAKESRRAFAASRYRYNPEISDMSNGWS